MEDLKVWDQSRARDPVELPWRLRGVDTPLKWQEWDQALSGHPDQEFQRYIAEGIREGFRIGFDYSRQRGQMQSSRGNMLSAAEHPEVVRSYLAKECSEGRVLGPFDPASFPQVHTSKFGVIPKGSSGEWRLIIDLSHPEGGSTNDGISEARSALSYVTIQDAAKAAVLFGEGALLAKVDVKSAYRNIPVHPEDRWLLGMMWEGSLFVDTALPFGLRSAPKIFTAIADAVEWVAKQAGVRFVIHYLDDFLLIGAPNSPECSKALETLLEIFRRLGLPVAVKKREGPATCLGFLGFELDSRLREVRLPRPKLEELRGLLGRWQGRKACLRKELESLVGKLAHAARVVHPGKTFLRRMYELLAGARQDHHRLRLNREFRSDLQWWATFLETWNGISMLTDQPAAVHCWTDASGQFGCGGWVPVTGAWFQLQWPPGGAGEGVRLREESIALKELLPIVIAGAVWGPGWRKARITVHCDNLGVVALVNSGYSRVPQIMHILRCLFFIRAHFQFSLHAVHVPGVENSLADAISRDNLHLLFSQVPGAVNNRVQVQPALLALLVERQPDWTSQAWTRLFRSCFPPDWPRQPRGAISRAHGGT